MRQDERHDDIRLFLRSLRRRLAPDTRVLGSHERLSSRRGRAVSQEELAEAVGVSRGWYALLENGAPIRPSISMLDRLAVALQATPQERATLFRLAIPALQSALTEALCPACGAPRAPHSPIYRPSSSRLGFDQPSQPFERGIPLLGDRAEIAPRFDQTLCLKSPNALASGPIAANEAGLRKGGEMLGDGLARHLRPRGKAGYRERPAFT